MLAAVLTACGGKSDSSDDKKDTKTESSKPAENTDPNACKVVDSKILLEEGKSCTISAEMKSKYGLFISGEISCTGGNIKSGGITSGTIKANGITIACK